VGYLNGGLSALLGINAVVFRGREGYEGLWVLSLGPAGGWC